MSGRGGGCTTMPGGLSVFSTCPESRTAAPEGYMGRVVDAARWSEAVGCEGMLVYSENGLVDPWLLAQVIVRATERLEPLVAVQPVYMHPYAVATMLSTLAFLHGRRTQLNMVAGGFRNDLIALGDETPHDERYARLLSYAQLIRDLAIGEAPITRRDAHVCVNELRLQPPVPSGLQPKFMISGSSEAGLAAAEALGATAVRYPRPAGQEEAPRPGLRTGVRLGMVVREDRAEAWRVALERFPEDRSGQITHRLAMSVSDSHWHAQLSELALEAAQRNSVYWLGPFENYKTFCPYLVGEVGSVAAELAAYLRQGVDTFILDIPPSLEELEYCAAAFAQAAAPAAR
jgi:alkanesulfonate monooxygenase